MGEESTSISFPGQKRFQKRKKEKQDTITTKFKKLQKIKN